MKVKTHTFPLGKYRVLEGHGWDGVCDCPDDKEHPSMMEVRVLAGKGQRALRSQVHEFLHACGCPDSFLHREDDPCDNLARALVRMGWRRECESKADMEA